MSTTARKARKRAGIKFEKAAKVGTPPEQRSYVTNNVQGPHGTKNAGKIQPRATKKVMKFLSNFTKKEEI